MHRLILANAPITYYPQNFHYTHGNLSAFGTFMMIIMLAILAYVVFKLIRCISNNCRGCCHNSRKKMYYKLMGDNYELRKEFKRDIADVKDSINELRDGMNKESDY